jgi:hypothetical protein
MRNELHVAGA